MRRSFSNRAAALAAAVLVTAVVPADPARAAALYEISGTVRDVSGRPVPLASVAADGTAASAKADEAGLFRLRLPKGTFTLAASAPGFVGEPRKLSVEGELAGFDLVLVPLPRKSEALVVSAIRADEKAPVPRTDLDRREIEARSDGKEIGAFLAETPSITQYSDTGLGNGYNYLALRGVGQTRVNMTFDGVPLNDPEDSAVYTVDYANLLGSTESLQVQRGVGTSTFGAAAFAGSINFASLDLADSFGGSARLGLGSFGTAMASAGVQSGLFGPDLKLYLRASWQETNGFRDSSGVLQKSLYYGVGRDVGSTTFKISGFVGQERTQEAFLAADKETLDQNLRANPLSPPEQDRFTLGLVQAQVTHVLGPRDSVALQGFYEGTSGWYRLFADPERTTLWQYDLSWHFYGGTATYRHESGPFGLTVGLNAYGYESTHSRSVTEAIPDYENHGFKTQASGFVKLGWDAGRWHLVADGQVRWAKFRYEGDVGPGSADWTFFNPKLGARYDVSPSLSVFASVGRTTREPARSDLLLGEDNATVPHDFGAVDPERVTDFEAGVNWKKGTLTLAANLYAMEFRNEIALTGELSEIGLPLRRNVGQSYRRGLELDASWQALPWLRAVATLNASHNRIQEWTQFYDVYDAEGIWIGSTSRTYTDVNPLLTPQFVANAGVDVTPVPGVTVGVRGRYVSRSYLDNTSNDAFVTPRFFNLNASLTVGLERLVKPGRPQLKIEIHNVLDNKAMFPSGYSYLYYTQGGGGETLGGISYYYPLATTSVIAMLDLGF